MIFYTLKLHSASAGTRICWWSIFSSEKLTPKLGGGLSRPQICATEVPVVAPWPLWVQCLGEGSVSTVGISTEIRSKFMVKNLQSIRNFHPSAYSRPTSGPGISSTFFECLVFTQIFGHFTGNFGQLQSLWQAFLFTSNTGCAKHVLYNISFRKKNIEQVKNSLRHLRIGICWSQVWCSTPG